MTQGWESLKGFLVSYTGLAYYLKREDQLMRAIHPRMEATGQEGFDSYLSYLKNTPDEVEKIVARLTVGETYFFRDRPQFQALNDTVLADLAKKGGGVPARPCLVCGLLHRTGAVLSGLSCLQQLSRPVAPTLRSGHRYQPGGP